MLAPEDVSVLIAHLAERGHLLEKVITAYGNEGVGEVIVKTGYPGGEAYNLAAKEATGKVLFLAADDQVPFPGSIKSALETLEKGHIPCNRLCEGNVGFRSGYDDLPDGEEVSWVRAPFLLVETFNEIGPMIKELSWYNDLDYSDRIKAHGLKIVSCEGFKFDHLNGDQSWLASGERERQWEVYERKRIRDSGCRLTIIVPTIGRTTLDKTLSSIVSQMNVYDELIVVADRNYQESGNQVAQFILRYPELRIKFKVYTLMENGKEINNWGHPQRNYAIKHARGTHIITIDDDDVYCDKAFADFREHAKDIPSIFRMEYKNHYLLWQHEGLLECGNFGTPCFLVPNIKPKRMPQFGSHYAGDADYIIEAAEIFGAVDWRPEIVANIRPHESAEPTVNYAHIQ